MYGAIGRCRSSRILNFVTTANAITIPRSSALSAHMMRTRSSSRWTRNGIAGAFGATDGGAAGGGSGPVRALRQRLEPALGELRRVVPREAPDHLLIDRPRVARAAAVLERDAVAVHRLGS